jgi:hypothetical protein
MLMLGVELARGDGVDVDVEGPGRGGMEPGLQAGLLGHFATGHAFARGFAWLAVAAGLKPSLELRVVEQEDLGAVFRHHEAGPREVTFKDAAVEGIGVGSCELEHQEAIPLLPGFARLVKSEKGGKTHTPDCMRLRNRRP